jgi:Cd2+/Zn2+-exporting ATPase
VISTPVSLVSAMTHAASRGVLIKGGRYLEALSGVRVFAFDKTGTLTRGEPAVVSVQPLGHCREGEDHCGLRHAAALEVQSSHPVARALVAEARAKGVAVSPAEGVTELGGRGIQGSVGGVSVVVASHDYLHETAPHDASVCEMAAALADRGQSAVLVHHDNEVCTLFGIADEVRPESERVMAALRAQGTRTVMLTGDQALIAGEIARQVGVDEVQAELLPEAKLSAIEALSARYGRVAMVGDGINDAPALARAEVGIAMGGAGTAQAMETAGIVLMGDDLGQLPFIVRLSRRARRTVMGNILFALAVKAAVFALAAAGAATLWMAIAADVGASLAVILNGMRLRRG